MVVMTKRLLLMMKEISKCSKRVNNDTDDDGASSDEDVNSGQGDEKGRTLTAYQVKVAFCTQPKSFLIEDDVEIF